MCTLLLELYNKGQIQGQSSDEQCKPLQQRTYALSESATLKPVQSNTYPQ